MSTNMEVLMNKLFKWRSSIEIEGITFYVRVVGDQVIDDARKYALIGSRTLRKELRDPTTDNYLIYLDPLSDLTEEELRTLNTSIAMREIMRDYLSSTPRPIMGPLPTNPSQEQQEEYEAAKEQRENDYIQNMTEYVESWRTEFQAGLEKRDHEFLLRMARKNRTDQVCEELFSSMFEEYVVAQSVYSDDKYKNKTFTLEQFKELPNEVRVKLRNAYNDITISPDQIKN